MIEEIPHPCKFEEFGCQIEQRLDELVDHEENCPQRTIKCPSLKCNQVIQIRKYYDHALANNCVRRNHLLFPSLPWDGSSISQSRLTTTQGIDVHGLLSTDWSWKMHAFYFERNANHPSTMKFFYFHRHYFSSKKIWAFYISLAEHFSVAEQYLAKLTLKNFNDERKYLTNVQNVVSMDSAPKDKDAVLASPYAMLVPQSMMCGFLKWVEVDGEGTKHADIEMAIEIL